MAERFYSDEEAQEILRIAAHRSSGLEGISRDRLLESASEMGISAEDILAAELEIDSREQHRRDLATFTKSRKSEFACKISGWLSMSAGLIGLDYVLGGFRAESLLHSWAIWPVGFFGVSVVKSAVELVSDLSINREKAFANWIANRDKAALKLEGSDDIKTHDVVRCAIEESEGKKLLAVKLVRERTGLGLAEAKAAVEFQVQNRC